MSAPATSTDLLETPSCAYHPGREAVGTCARCGAFHCEAESIRHGEHTYCGACGGRPEVGHPERLRRERWGKRDGGRGAWFLGVPWARPAPLVLPPLWLGGFVLKGRDLGVLAPTMGLALWLNASTRVRLVFRQEVDLERQERLWDARENNPLARDALVCGLAGLVVPLAMGLGVAGLRRVDLEATPPMGRRRQALAGLVLGGLGLVGWAGVLLWRLSRGLPLLP